LFKSFILISLAILNVVNGDTSSNSSPAPATVASVASAGVLTPPPSPATATSTPSPSSTSLLQCCTNNYGTVPTSAPTSSCSGSFSWTPCSQTCYTIKCCGTSSLGTGCAYYGDCSSSSPAQEGTNYNIMSAFGGATGVTCTASTGITATKSASGAITNVQGAAAAAAPNLVLATLGVLAILSNVLSSRG
jgi:hypothetical protein